jgi:hypothetical protein
MRLATPKPATFLDPAVFYLVKKSSCVLALVAAGLLGLASAGCKKQGEPQSADALQASYQQMRAALVKASPEVQSNLYSHVDYSLRYDKFIEAMMYLDHIANDPSLNDSQKKAVNQVIEQLKTKVQNGTGGTPPKPAP